jgi:hypothetical protein
MTQHRPIVNTDDFIALETVDPDRLDGDMVQTSDGNTIGRVRDVKLGSDGAPKMIAIQLNDGRDVRVPQEELMFNPKANVLLANVDADQMAKDDEEGSPSNAIMSKREKNGDENSANGMSGGTPSNGSGVNPSEGGAGGTGQ